MTSDEIMDEIYRLKEERHEDDEFDTEKEKQDTINSLEDLYYKTVRKEAINSFWEDAENGINPWTGDKLTDLDELFPPS
ncbi:hypothetical protein [Halanaerobium hydrogeniformans]|uniref:Uncharacterized protein n=1 Tax=Halanaerobium hydrogeniformans TaxID=656519 RepID=E4RNJ5_HALHG|nr:hypothetical protein [Halanaerobium hydrogeniformans]ADQ13530.1 hypothetical protein Halsa_0030 [Halanaerobium hydrogeniformans]